MSKEWTPVIAIHGGAGIILKEKMGAKLEGEYRDTLKTSLETGYGLLQAGKSSLEAVEKAIIVMEDSPLFNAGRGAVFTHGEEHELDAGIMDGNALKAGAVAMVQGIKNPISLSRTIMEQSDHVLLGGAGAEHFAVQQGFELVEKDYFSTEFRLNQLQEAKKNKAITLDHTPLGGTKELGTVGAVALDNRGNLAAGISTGGMTNKLAGRIGDSAIIGAGFYANNATCAVSTTGYGEYFMRNVVGYDLSALMEYKSLSLRDAASIVNERMKVKNRYGGLIAVDKHGDIVMPFSSKGMYRGYVDEAGQVTVEIYKD